MPREASKCRAWEKDRRNRLQKNFEALAKSLPCYDPSIKLSKLIILEKAAAYVEELKSKLSNLASSNQQEKGPLEDELNTLQEHVRKLITRNEQLCNLLKDAGITIPTQCGNVKEFKSFLPWSNRISPEQAKEFVEKEAQKENKSAQKKKGGKSPKKNSSSPNAEKPTKGKQKKASKNMGVLSVINLQTSTHFPILASNLAKSQSCYVITNAPTLGGMNNLNSSLTAVTNSRLLSTPIVASSIKPSVHISKANPNINQFCTGTLILANGNIVPVLPQTAVLPTTSLFTNPPSVLVNPQPNNATFIVVPTKKAKRTKNIKMKQKNQVDKKSLSRIRPRYSLPKPMPPNKLPLPHLPSKVISKSEIRKPKIKSKTVPKTKNFNLNNKGASKSTGNKSVIAKDNANQTGTKRELENSCDMSQKRQKLDEIPKAEKKIVKMENAELKELTSVSKTNDDPEQSDNSLSKVNNVINDSEITNNQDTSVLHECSKNNGVDNNVQQIVLSKEDTVIANNENIEILDNLLIQTSKVVKSPAQCVKENQIATPCLDKQPVENPKLENIPPDKEKSVPSTDVNHSTTESNTILKSIQEALLDFPLVENINEEKSTDKEALTQNTGKHVEKLEKNVATPSEVKPNEKQTNANAIQKSTEAPIKTATVSNESKTLNTPIEEIPVDPKQIELSVGISHSEFSNDIFSSLQVPMGGQNPESTSPTAAFLLAFPLVSSLTSVKVTEVIEEDNSDSRHGTPTLLQIGNIETTKTNQQVLHSESLTPSLLNFDSFSFFSSKDVCGNFYPAFDPVVTSANDVSESLKPFPTCGKSTALPASSMSTAKKPKIICEPQKTLPKTNPVVTPHKNNVGLIHNTQTQNCSANCSSVTYSASSIVYQGSGSSSVSKSITTASYSKTDGFVNNNNNNSLNQNQVSYNEVRPKLTCVKTQELKVTCHCNTATSNTYTVSQCNTFNPFADFSKPNTVSTYANFSKPHNEPLYTNSNYNYYQSESNFVQNNYSQSKNHPNKNSQYDDNFVTFRREAPAHSHDNYYGQKMKDKFSSNNVKNANSAKSCNPKPPINWMMTPDVRQQPNSDYVVPSFGKEIDYASNTFYPTSFVPSTQTMYFNTNPSLYPSADVQNATNNENRKQFDNTLPAVRNEYDDNQFSWSPTKIPQFLDTSHSFVSSTLPTLVGDLALGTQPQYGDSKIDQIHPKDNVKSKENNRRNTKQNATFDNQSNFLSVSQLVDNKPEQVPARTTNRRNSGGRNAKNNAQKKRGAKIDSSKESGDGYANSKLDPAKDISKHHSGHHYNVQAVCENNWMMDCNKNNNTRHGNKNSHSSYSAEALIGHQNQNENVAQKQKVRQQNYGTNSKSLQMPTYISDNIMPYFPPVELGQDNSFIQQNQNYHHHHPNHQSASLSHSFPTKTQNNVYTPNSYISTAPSITPSYLPSTTGLIPDLGSHDYSLIGENVTLFTHAPSKNSSKPCNKSKVAPDLNVQRLEERHLQQDCSVNGANNAYGKKSKPKHSTESANLTGFVDFSFLSMPSAINSPVLPDDFHTHTNFLPPPPTPGQLYPCKNPLYSKQGSDISSGSLLPLSSVAVTRNNVQNVDNNVSVGPSLTNFNLSTIFPEINKGAPQLPGIYPDVRNKDYNCQKNYPPPVQPHNKIQTSSYQNPSSNVAHSSSN